jgi:uncharacterized membrane protein YgdD (TMEM256/DUF423 family)
MDARTSLAMRWIIAAGAALGACGVLAGAFGAHALKRIIEPAQLTTWDTAAEYQMTHAIALVVIGVLGLHQRRSDTNNQTRFGGLYVSAVCLFAGTLIFSGSLYAWVLTGTHIFVMLTPAGGVLIMAGWLALMFWAIRGRRHQGH